jgi:CRP-like cAMP-binding protein
VLEPAALESIAGTGSVRPYRKGQILFATGDPGETLFVVLEGLVKVYVISPSGDEMNLGLFRPATVFGEVAVADGGPRTAFGEIVEPTRLFVIGRAQFFALLGEHPMLIERYLKALGDVIRRSTDRAEDLVFMDLQGRVAKLLLHLAEGSDVIDLKISQQELANMVGGSRPTVNQILKTFEGRGYIALDGRKIALTETSELERLARTR